MAERKKKITLYFTHEASLTDHDIAVMDTLPNPRHRNAAFIEPGGKLEPCDFVAGPAVPEDYAHIPRADGEVEEEASTGADMTSAQLKAELDSKGIKYAQNAKKADLVLLYDAANA